MPADVMENWLRSRLPAQVNGLRLRPLENSVLPDTPLTVRRGQAMAVFLVADDRAGWILKKFHQGCCLDEHYLKSVSTVLPKHAGLESGATRRLLSSADLRKLTGCHHSEDFRRWLDGTVLMRRVTGLDWATVADELRDGHLQLDHDQRLQLCRELAELVEELERHGCAHRDLSSGNVFLDTTAWKVILIDFDSVYHPSLTMPAATTCGTEGYTPAFAWRNGAPSPAATWCPHADRFALALLIVEFLVLGRNAPLGAEGGMFDQEALRMRVGTCIGHATANLRREFPDALALFEAAIRARNCDTCPAPADWIRFCNRLLGCSATPPPLTDIESVPIAYFEQILRKRRPAAPVWPAPRLADLPDAPVKLAPVAGLRITLPDDPWASQPCALGGPEDRATVACPTERKLNPGSGASHG